MTRSEESRLIRLARKGDLRAFGELVDRHKVLAFNLAYRIVRQREEAQDIAQDAFVQAYLAIRDFRGDAKFSTWLYRIVYNLCMSRLAQRKATSSLSDPGVERALSRQAAEKMTASPEELVEREDWRQCVWALVATLPPRYRAVLAMYYLLGYSYKEIAEITDMPMGTVKTHLFRAKGMLRQKIERSYDKQEMLR